MINHQTIGSTWSKMTLHGWSWTIRIWWLRIVEPAWNGDIEPISYEISLDSTRVLSVTSIQYQGDRVTMAVTNLTDLGSRSGRPSLYADLKRQILNTYSQNNVLVGGFNPSEKYEFVSWGYEFSNIWKVIKFHGSSHQQPNFNGIFHCHPAMGVPPWLWKSMGNPRRDGFVKAWPNSLRGTLHFWTHLYIYIHLYTYIYICMYNIYMYILSIITWSR